MMISATMAAAKMIRKLPILSTARWKWLTVWVS